MTESFGNWNLVIGACLEFVISNLEFWLKGFKMRTEKVFFDSEGCKIAGILHLPDRDQIGRAHV